jgi:RimJ/RimL family protein N-acetyltransferase
MKYIFVWLENDEQIAGVLQHCIDESKRAGRMAYILAARVAGTGEFAGLTFIEIDLELSTTGEVGIVLLPEYQASGYGREILLKYMEFGFDTLSLHRVFGKCDELNSASARLIKQRGLTYEGMIREHVWLRDHWRSTRYYGILTGEYAALNP